MELSIKTESFHNISLSANGMYLRMLPGGKDGSAHYTGNLLLEYNDNIWKGQLFGHYLKLGDVGPPTFHGKADSR